MHFRKIKLFKETHTSHIDHKVVDGIPTVALVLKTSKMYTLQHLIYIYKQVARAFQGCNIVTLADDPSVPGFIPLVFDFDGYWSKMELFRRGLFDGPVLFTDIDNVITSEAGAGSIVAKLKQIPKGSFYMIPSFTRSGGWMSGVMAWNGDFSYILEDFLAHASSATNQKKRAGGDQEFIAMSLFSHGVKIKSINNILKVGHLDAGLLPPKKKPSCDIFCYYTASSKPWSRPAPWVPKLKEDISDHWFITTWFGSDKLRLQAACGGLVEHTKRSNSCLVELTSSRDEATAFPFWSGHHLKITGDTTLWQKEAMQNIGARYAIEHGAKYLTFVDADAVPLCEGIEEIIVYMLKKYDFLQPWGYFKDSYSEYMSYLYKYIAKGIIDGPGQGFSISMTADWFNHTGGFNTFSIVGGGDAVTLYSWLPKHKRLPWPSIQELIDNYKGPKGSFAYIPVIWKHFEHGPRTNRNYATRHKPFDKVGGYDKVVRYNPQTQLMEWKDNDLAKKIKSIRKMYKREVGLEEIRKVVEAL